LVWGGCGVDSPGSGQGPLAGCCECGDEPSGSGTTELVIPYLMPIQCFKDELKCRLHFFFVSCIFIVFRYYTTRSSLLIPTILPVTPVITRLILKKYPYRSVLTRNSVSCLNVSPSLHFIYHVTNSFNIAPM
jgi:hypothetical protein